MNSIASAILLKVVEGSASWTVSAGYLDDMGYLVFMCIQEVSPESVNSGNVSAYWCSSAPLPSSPRSLSLGASFVTHQRYSGIIQLVYPMLFLAMALLSSTAPIVFSVAWYVVTGRDRF